MGKGGQWSYALFLAWVCYLVVSAVVMFTRGFLLSRAAQTERTLCQPYADIPCGPREAGADGLCSSTDRLASLLHDVNASTRACPPKRGRAVVLVVDALKYEFAAYDDSPDPPPNRNRLRILTELQRAHPDRTRLYEFLADPPTTTLQRLKGLTTGSLPTFVDAGSNFASSEINEDNVIDQLAARGGKAVLLGDDTWLKLYPDRWVRSLALPSFNTWDLDTVDNAIKSRLPEEIVKDDWSLLVAHFLGVDHCGHRYGPSHPEMVRKLNEMDRVIRDVAESIDNDTVLFVIGDHGMTSTGDHGGETDAEVTSAMFMYSPHKLLSPPELLSPKVVRQVDFVPTLSSILGLPPPYSNLGALILNALPFSGDPRIPYRDWEFALINLWANVKQVTNYIKKYSQISDQFSSEKIESIEKKFIILSHRVQTVYNERAFHSFSTDAREFLITVRSMCQEVWIQFDSFSMSRGLLLIFLTIFFCYMIVDGIPPDRLPEIFRSSFLWCSYGAMGGAVAVSVVCYHLLLIENLELTILFSTGMISVFMFAMLVIQNWELIAQNWYENARRRNWLDGVARACSGLSACALFSNSYVVEEGTVLSFLLISLLLSVVYHSGLPKYLLPLFVSIGIAVTCSRHFKTCREEQGECYFKAAENNLTTPYHLVLGLVALALFVSLTRLWLRSAGNLIASETMLWRYAPTVVAVCIGAHWVASWGTQRAASWRADSLARIVFGIIITSILVLIIKPLSVYVVPKQNESISIQGQENIVPQLFNQMKGMFNRNANKKLESRSDNNVPIVYGLATVYSSAFVMLSICITLFIALLLGPKSAPSIVLLSTSGALILALLAVSRYHNATTLVQLVSVDTCDVQCWVLLSLYFFYATGHQAALSSIQWSAAFIGTGGHFQFNAIPAALVLINTFGSQLLTGLMLPLLVLAPFSLYVMWGQSNRNSTKVDIQRGELLLYERDAMLTAAMFNVSAKYILYHSVRMFICMLAATVHCRHLMVWKVFAPKLIFEGIGLFVTLGAVLLSYLLLLRVHSRLDVFLEKLTKSS